MHLCFFVLSLVINSIVAGTPSLVGIHWDVSNFQYSYAKIDPTTGEATAILPLTGGYGASEAIINSETNFYSFFYGGHMITIDAASGKTIYNISDKAGEPQLAQYDISTNTMIAVWGDESLGLTDLSIIQYNPANGNKTILYSYPNNKTNTYFSSSSSGIDSKNHIFYHAIWYEDIQTFLYSFDTRSGAILNHLILWNKTQNNQANLGLGDTVFNPTTGQLVALLASPNNDPQTYDVGVINVETGEVTLTINTDYFGQSPTLSLDVANQILYAVADDVILTFDLVKNVWLHNVTTPDGAYILGAQVASL